MGGISKSGGISGSKCPIEGRKRPMWRRNLVLLARTVMQCGENVPWMGEKWYFGEKLSSSLLQVSDLVLSCSILGRKGPIVQVKGGISGRKGHVCGGKVDHCGERVSCLGEHVWHFWCENWSFGEQVGCVWEQMSS